MRTLKVPWPGDKCILCLNKTILSKEHLIPEALGGKLTAEFLCLSCNSELGRNLEANAKSDPAVFMAAKTMIYRFTTLATSLIQSHPHIAYSDQGPALGSFKNGDFHVKSKRLVDGSVIQPTDLGRKSLLKCLMKSGYQEVTTRKAIASFDDAPDNKRL